MLFDPLFFDLIKTTAKGLITDFIFNNRLKSSNLDNTLCWTQSFAQNRHTPHLNPFGSISNWLRPIIYLSTKRVNLINKVYRRAKTFWESPQLINKAHQSKKRSRPSATQQSTKCCQQVQRWKVKALLSLRRQPPECPVTCERNQHSNYLVSFGEYSELSFKKSSAAAADHLFAGTQSVCNGCSSVLWCVSVCVCSLYARVCQIVHTARARINEERNAHSIQPTQSNRIHCGHSSPIGLK